MQVLLVTVSALTGLLTAPSAPRTVARAPPVGMSAREEVVVQAGLDDEKTRTLFAWISMAFGGDPRYNNLMLAFASIFAEHQPGSQYAELVADALACMPPEDEPVGPPVGLRDREYSSLGAMGANQWTGAFRTRPHALLDVRPLGSVDEWIASLPRSPRRTLAKAAQQDFDVVVRPIRGGEPAPHSSCEHFRCVVEHEVRLLGTTADGFFDALGHAIGRYQGCTGQAGEIREYRDAASGRLLAFAHEVRKGRVIRGQWFYSTDEATKRYVWFHSVRDLVQRAIDDERVDVVDLGPSGTDAFSQLKERYGFASVDDWHKVADYRGPFLYDGGATAGEPWDDLDPPDWLFEPTFLDRLTGRAAPSS